MSIPSKRNVNLKIPLENSSNNFSNNYDAAYLDIGDVDSVTLVFLHGFLGESSAWLPIIQELQNAHPNTYRCIALDLLGFGESSKPQLKYTIWHQVEFLQGFLTAILPNDRNIYLIGHSYGGWTAAAYTLRNQAGNQVGNQLNPVQALILIAPAGIRDDSFVGRYNYLKPLLWESPTVDLVLKSISPIARLLGKTQEFDVIIQARKALVAQPVAKSFIYDRLRPEDAIDTVEKDIHRITLPTLVIAGDLDDTIPLWHCQFYADNIPNAKIKILANATHALIQSHSKEISKEISEEIAEPTEKRSPRT